LAVLAKAERRLSGKPSSEADIGSGHLSPATIPELRT
jgi:hypothetical protein